MNYILERAGRIWLEFSSWLSVRRDKSPIDSLAKLGNFVATRSAYVAQKALYGYVKARMGINYPRMFEDPKIIESLNIARQHVFAACLSDLAVYAVGKAMRDQPIGDEDLREIARYCYAGGLRENTDQTVARFSVQDGLDEFDRRLADTDWRTGAGGPEDFTRSPKALFRWAPIADELKQLDAEIVENSIRFAWRDVREEFQKRINADAVWTDWSQRVTAQTAPS